MKSWIDFLIENFSPPHFAEEIKGDMEELYVKDKTTKGLAFARRRYVVNGLGFLMKSFFWKKSSHAFTTSSPMLKNYFKMASRSLMAYKGTTAINIIGLVVGMASALVIFFVIRFELSFDTFHSNAVNTYRIVRVSGADMSEYRVGVAYPVPVALKAEIPSVVNITSIEYFGGANIDVMDASGSSVRKFREENGFALVEPSFFDVFDYKGTDFRWLAGNPGTALIEPFSVVLTETIAKKYFGEDVAIGRTLRFQKKYDCKVTGVIEDFPANTDFPFTALLSYSSMKTLAGEERLSNWFAVNDTHCTYVVVRDGVTQEALEAEIAMVHAAHTAEELHKSRHYLLQKLSDVHYDTRFMNLSGRTISRETITALGIIAAFLLLTGSINYINLSTAQSSLRSKEIGLRKVMGGNRKNLMLQFFTETFIIVFVAGVLALALSEILLANLQSLLNIKHTDNIFTDPFVLLCLALIVVVVTAFAGFYPSLAISRFNPLVALKTNFSTEHLGGLSLRKVLVVVQFTITQMLVVGTFILVSQMHYFGNADMGFDRDAILTARVSGITPDKMEVMDQQLRSQSFVSGVSFSFTLPSGVNRSRSYYDIGLPEANALEDYLVYEYEGVDPNYLDLYNIKLLAGRNLKTEDTVGNILINKTLIKNLELGTPAEAVGRILKRGDGRLYTVVGVVDDFYSNSMKEGVDNIVMTVNPKNYRVASIKLNMNDKQPLQEKVQAIEKIWTAALPDDVFSYQFFDENIEAFYRQEKKYAQLFQLFSGIFLLIGCLGLYGLITFVINRKGKEVAIRKVLGANVSSILMLFSKEYVQLILLSFVLATPVAYSVVNSWLSNFANRIPLQWWLFVLPGFMVLLIALLVVSSKSLKAANANPVDRLKYE